MRLLIQHRTVYRYPRPAQLGPHQIRLRPAEHAKARVESYSLRVTEPGMLRWTQDAYANHVAHLTYPKGSAVPALAVEVELAVDIRPVNPFDFFVDDRCKALPFTYPPDVRGDLTPFLDLEDPALGRGRRFRELLAATPAKGDTIATLVATNQLVNGAVRYVIREEAGIWTPEETLAQGRGSCRDSAVLLMALLRERGLAARFASGYLVQLTDEGMIPDEPKGVGSDVVDLHAWCEVWLAGAGWIGLDATSGLLCGEGHIPLACVARPAAAAPVTGTSDVAADEVRFEMKVGRLGHEPRPTVPYTEETWHTLVAASDRADEALRALGLTLTVGGEPTFNSREHPEAPEWNGDALGATKWEQGRRLAEELKRRLCPGGVLLTRTGKAYPGEPLPRWALDVVGRRGDERAWQQRGGTIRPAGSDTARALLEAIARRLGITAEVHAAYEDPWPALRDEAELPVEIDPLAHDLDDPDERRRLSRLLGRGLGREVGYVLPLRHRAGWQTERWRFRREHLFLVPGDSPIGLRLPLQSLGGPAEAPSTAEAALAQPDPRIEEARKAAEKAQQRAGEEAQRVEGARAAARTPPAAVRTALCVEPRDGALHVFLPPLATAGEFFELVEAVGAAAAEVGVAPALEGYPPPWSPDLFRITVTPDPGVLEVNVPPCASAREHLALFEQIFEAALHAGLHTEKYLLDGRLAGSGGGHHLTLGGPTALASPFVLRPDLLASLITFFQHHPSLSYLFTGLFVGPTSQAPRVDEGRHDALYELEIAFERAFERRPSEPAWLGDLLFRHLLVDLTGNTHRAEICIDKLFDWRTPHGRQGLVELRAFEMPPHPRMAVAQVALVRALVAAFAGEPYRHPLVRWGAELHDRFLLPYYLWKDFEDVLAYLDASGVPLPADAFRPFLELRCPVAGRIQLDTVAVEVRTALEPWNVLGEESTRFGTARYVDSSCERLELRAEGLVPERHRVLVNGWTVPLRPTGTAGESVGGVRFRAWAPAHALHPHLGIHHPLRFEIWDAWARRCVAAGAYHVWHPEGRAFDAPPLTRFEAAARRARRFTREGPSPWPVVPRPLAPHPDAPWTTDLRRWPVDRPMPEPDPEAEAEA